MRVKLEAVYHAADDGEPYIKMNLLSKNRLSILFRLWWLLRGWRHTELTLTVKKASGKLV